MKLKFLVIILLVIATLFVQKTTLKAQNNDSLIRIGSSWIFEAVKIDVEFKFLNNWYQIAPEFQLYTNESYFFDAPDTANLSDYYSSYGIGLSINRRKYMETEKMLIPYYGYGGGYMFYDMRFSYFKQLTYTENGNTYYTMDFERVNQETHNIKAFVTGGILLQVEKSFFMDAFVSAGAKFSINHVDSNKAKPIQTKFMGQAYTGPDITFGIRVGFIIDLNN